jgi:hypothetical protein
MIMNLGSGYTFQLRAEALTLKYHQVVTRGSIAWCSNMHVYESEAVGHERADLKCREVKTGFCRKRSIQIGSSETLIG